MWFVRGGCWGQAVGMVKRSVESERLLAQLDSELVESAERAGMKLTWSACDREHLDRMPPPLTVACIWRVGMRTPTRLTSKTWCG